MTQKYNCFLGKLQAYHESMFDLGGFGNGRGKTGSAIARRPFQRAGHRNISIQDEPRKSKHDSDKYCACKKV